MFLRMNYKHTILKKTNNFICWFPKKGCHSLVLGLQDYKIFHKISRTVHFDEFREIHNEETLSPKKFHVHSHSHLGSRYPSCEVLWFGAHDPFNEYSFYGNVSMVIDVRNIIRERLWHKFYFVEVVDFKTISASRILISKKEYDLPLYNPYEYGGPWYIDPSGHHFHLINTRRFDGTSNTHGHKLEFMFEETAETAKELYDQSVPFPTDHCEANSGKPYSCKNHGPEKSCPSPWKKEEVHKMIEDLGLSQRKTVCRKLENEF